jgi:NitT/TauT family transport system substrate-binding protein
MRSIRLTGLFVVAVLALLLLSRWTMEPDDSDVRIVAPPAVVASLPHWVAEERGFYADEGLVVSTLQVTSSDLMVQALLDGDADVLASVSLVDVVNGGSRSRRKPLIFSHSRTRSDPPFESILVLRESTISALRDLAGKRMAVYPGITSTAAVRRYLAANKVDTSGIQFIPLPPPEHLMALQRGDVAASHMYEPNRSLTLQARRTRELAGSVYAYFQDASAVGVSAMSARFITERPDAAQRYLRAWNRAIDFIRTNHSEARNILAARLKLPIEVANVATRVDATRSDELDTGSVARTVRFFQELGAIADSILVDETLFVGLKR